MINSEGENGEARGKRPLRNAVGYQSIGQKRRDKEKKATPRITENSALMLQKDLWKLGEMMMVSWLRGILHSSRAFP